MNPEELMAHADFVRRLARSLVLDDNRAADIEQDTWMATLRGVPESDGALRAWFRRVALNFARKRHRGELRRQAREEKAARDSCGTAPSAAEVAAREEMRRRVVDAVMGLEEPWRSAILVRYYEDLPLDRAAARLGVPKETLRTRLKKGLRLLRERLDEAHGGDRKAWCLALLPLAGMDPTGAAPAAVPARAAAGGSTAGAGMKLFVLAGTVLVAGTGIFLWNVLSPEEAQVMEIKGGIDRVSATTAGKEPGVAPLDVGIASSSPSRGASREVAAASAEPSSREALPPESRGVTWRGKVIDYDGSPGRDVELRLYLQHAFRSGERPTERTVAKSGKDGSFRVAGLVPGKYTLHLGFKNPHFPDVWDSFEWGRVTFQEPGAVNKDVLVAEGKGTIVAGVVVDEDTGLPLRQPPPLSRQPACFYVALHNPDLDAEIPHADVDPERGTFCMRGVPPMQYDLYFLGGLYRKVLPGFVDTREEKVIRDLRLAVPAFGCMEITLSGFDYKQRRSVKATFETRAAGTVFPAMDLFHDRNVALLPCPLGKGRVLFTAKGLGSTARSFLISKAEVSRIFLSRADFTPESPRAVELAVSLKHADGSPLSGITLGFQKKMSNLPDLGHAAGVTDERGSLRIPGITPGIWSAWCTALTPERLRSLKTGKGLLALRVPLRVILFHGIEISSSPEAGFTLDLVAPGGKVRGVLYDRTTGLPLPEDRMVLQWILVNAPDESFRVNGLSVGGKDARFELTGIPAGRFQLTAAVFGYKLYRSPLFSLRDAQVLDVGRVLLEPVGTMEIEVTDAQGNPLKFWADWPGKKGYLSIFGLDRLGLAKGRTLFGDLPFGPLSVKVTARGFEPKTITLPIEENRRTKAKVVLERGPSP